MNKGLEALKEIKKEILGFGRAFSFYDKNKQVSDYAVETMTKCCETIEKELKALEIVKKKRVIMTWIYDCKSIHEYNSLVIGKYMLTEEEYDLLKEVLL